MTERARLKTLLALKRGQAFAAPYRLNRGIQRGVTAQYASNASP